MKTEPFDIEKAKTGRKIVTKGGEEVEILSYSGRGSFPIMGYREDEENLSSWTEEGRFYTHRERANDLLLVSLEFPDPPAGHAWHNPLGLTPEQVGEEYRLALVGEFIQSGKPYDFYSKKAPNWRDGYGGGFIGQDWNYDIVIRLPKDTPFNIPAPAKPSFDQLIELVKQWGIDKGITGPDGKATLLKQLEKTQEELIETRDAVVAMNVAQAYSDKETADSQRLFALDGYGDQLVAIILGLEMLNSSVPEALQMAYDVISKRTGTMVGGQFVKTKEEPQ